MALLGTLKGCGDSQILVVSVVTTGNLAWAVNDHSLWECEVDRVLVFEAFCL